MAEVTNDGQVVGGLPQADPDEFLVRSQNAERIGRRRAAAALSAEVQRTGAADLDRFGDRRQVGGVFETIQEEPERITPERTGLDLSDFSAFLQSIQFEARDVVLGQNQFLSSFAPNVIGGA